MDKESTYHLVLDESVDVQVERKLNDEIEVYRPEAGSSDREVLRYSIRKQAPLVTRDQGDFVELDNFLDHHGILIDKQLHLRDRKLVAQTICSIMEEHQDHINNNILFISNFYGRF